MADAIKFSFGLWTIGWQAQDSFGSSTSAPLGAVEAVHRLADIGAWGFTFHGNDVFPFCADDSERRPRIDAVQNAARETGLVIEMVTTNTFTHPVFKDGALAHAAATYRADPKVQEAFGRAGIVELNEPTVAKSETFADLLADRSSFENFDVGAVAERDYGLVQLHELAVRHLIAGSHA